MGHRGYGYIVCGVREYEAEMSAEARLRLLNESNGTTPLGTSSYEPGTSQQGSLPGEVHAETRGAACYHAVLERRYIHRTGSSQGMRSGA